MWYKTGYCFNATDMYENFNTRLLKVKKVDVPVKYGVANKKMLCASILVYFFYLIICDIIENNVTFVFPLFGDKHAEIAVKPVSEYDMKEGIKKGVYDDIDLLKSNFKCYHLYLTWNNGQKQKPIYVNKRFKDVLTKYVNEGKVYY